MPRADLSAAIEQLEWLIDHDMQDRTPFAYTSYRHLRPEEFSRIRSYIAALRLLRAEQRRLDLCELEPGHAGQCEARRV
jgi:hypothetical protein